MKAKILQALLCVFCLKGISQQSFTNFGNLQINAGGSMSIFGNFTNVSTASFLNNGALYAKSNITSDQPAMAAGSGALFLNGTAAQIINGTTTFKTNQLTTNNASGFMLNTDLSVGGVHTFTSGIITTSVTPNYLVYEAGASYSGDNDANHVVGWIRKIGTTDFVFPVGNGTAERSISLNNLTAASEFTVKYNAPTPNTSQMVAPLVAINPNENWEVIKSYGGSATVTLNWNNAKVAFFNWTLPDIRAAAYNASNYWADAGGTATGNTSTTGTITSNLVSTFNRFTFGGTSYALPVLLLSFDAKRVNNYTEVLWKTAAEKNIDHFEVERSDNGNYFYTLTKVTAHNLQAPESYLSTDKNAIGNYAYYRLKIISTDGSIQYSSVVRVHKLNSISSLILKTNPVKNKLTFLSLNELSGSFDYRIFSAGAQLVQKGKLTIESGGQAEVSLSGTIRPGIYTVALSNNSKSFTMRFMVQ